MRFKTATKIVNNRTGTLFAVYNFLENELGVHWYEPGDNGIIYNKMPAIRIPVKSHSWISHFQYQHSIWNKISYDKLDKATPEEFKLTMEQVNAKKNRDRYLAQTYEDGES